MQLKKNKRYVIEWLDHFSQEGWFDLNPLDFNTGDVSVKTIGYFIDENENYIFLAHSLADSIDQCADIMAILKGGIVGEPNEI